MTDEFTNGRRTFLKSLGALGVAAMAGPAVAQSEDDAYHQTLREDLTDRGLPEGEFVYGTTEGAAIDAFTYEGAGSGTSSTFEVDDDEVPITQGVRIEINEDPDNDYDYTYQGFLTDRSFSEGDVLLGVAYVRSDVEGAQTQAGFKYRYTDPDGDTSYGDSYVQESATIEPGSEWERYYVPIEVGEKPDGSDHEPYLEFWVGFSEQVIEFGGVALVDYSGTDVAVGDLPAGTAGGGDGPGENNPLLDYAGREEDAQWREDARDRIDEIRKADLEVEVVGGDGNPIPEATVDVTMTDHAFDFGSAVSSTHINGDSEDDAQYREVFLENFNKAVIENNLKYPTFMGQWGDSKDGAIESLEWLDENDVPTRGHYLMWEEFQTDGGGGMAIEDSESLSDDELQDLLVERITNHAEDVGDLVTEWDMHNHPIWQSNFRSADGRNLGMDAVLEWWEAADDATDAELYTNEMGNVAGDFFRDQHHELVGELVDNDAPIDGIGFMGHVQYPDSNVTPPEEMLATYDRFAEYDLPILITEFDIQINSRDSDEEVEWQVDFLRDFLIATFSHEAVEGVMSWGFWAEDHWRPTGAYYDSDWTLRPHGEQFMDLVFDEWWTDESGETGSDGTYATRGFKGDYEITASVDDHTGETTVSLESAESVTIEIPDASGVEPDETTEASDEPTETDEETTEASEETTETSGPGFGVATGVAGLGAGAYLLGRERDDENGPD